ncbi:hypothetical protein FY034_13300 [Trichlorobacter lovleyi]|uniref:hypothetical protein n=1 Tax=Trichlorobacter lovleyi TaxID=313985 RepID=UPI00223F35D3|nr:hypothetical protein [Trichlorobacter lovleyi]QOX79866.1 hypothetical protein FY034_13300 [Trichlorobacter lovleyi]
MTQESGRYTWRCNQCGCKLTDSQVKIYQQKLLRGLDVASCSLCGGHATNMEQLQNLQRKQTTETRCEQRSARKNRIILFGSLALLLAMPGIVPFVCCTLVNLQFGMFKTMHVKMKMGALMLIGAACFTAVLAGVGGFVSVGLSMPTGFAGWVSSLMLWGLTIGIMVGMGLLIENTSSLGGKLYY